MKMNRPKKSMGWSVPEVLVVVVVLAILVALLMPVAGRLSGSGNDVKCLSGMRQYYIVLRAYQSEHDGWFPPGHRVYFNANNAREKMGEENPITFPQVEVATILKDGGYLSKEANLYCPSMRLDETGLKNYPDEQKRLRELVGYSVNAYLSQVKGISMPGGLWVTNSSYPGDHKMIAVGETSSCGLSYVKEHLDKALFGQPGPRSRSTLPRSHRYPDGLNFIMLDGHAKVLRRGTLNKDEEGWTDVMNKWGTDGRYVQPTFNSGY